MSDKKFKLKSCEARVEFFACRDKVFKMIEEGYPVKKIHEILFNDGIMRMSYKTLIELIHKYNKDIKSVYKISNKKNKQNEDENIQENSQDKQQEKKQEKTVKNLPAKKKKKGFGSGLHRDADEVC